MAYLDHFQLADDYIAHLDTVMVSITDPFITSRYTGFLAVTAVTVYELAIKTIFIDFAMKKHKVLENFTNTYFRRINGRIKTSIVKDEYVSKFGEKYVKRFDKKLKDKEKEILRTEGASVLTSYGNIIEWRNQFAHEGIIPQNATYDEVKKSYNMGKYVINCLAESMKR
ncbi:MAG: HEPN domain-containing protein [Planctomycetota bacterium]|jgi:hypothetical protein